MLIVNVATAVECDAGEDLGSNTQKTCLFFGETTRVITSLKETTGHDDDILWENDRI